MSDYSVERVDETGDKKVVKLQYPITVDGKRVDSLGFRRIKMRDLELANKKAAGKDEFVGEMTLIANLAEIPIEAVRQIDLVDMKEIGRVLQELRGEDG